MANENQDQDDDVFDSHMLKVWRQSAAFRRASFHAPDEIWNLFSEADNCSDIIDYFRALIKVSNIDPSMHGIEFFNVLKSKLTSWKCQSLWDLLNTRLKLSEYKQGTAAKGLNCLIIGSGPIGLRMAIEALLLGCKTVVVEKRTEFSRNNVLHLWPFLMTDFRGLGAKKFYGKFGAGCIEHINIKTLQCVLLKIALILGLEVHFGVSFLNLVEPTDEKNGWRGNYEPENHEVSKFTFDIVIAADGKKNVLPGFPQIELRGALAIGITCNFINNNTVEEAGVAEISGISYQYNPTFFNDMEAEYGVKLENIVYYKDETHYFVMTALKSSLLNLGVFKEDISDSSKLLNSSNINKKKLIEFARYAVNHATNHKLPEDLEFKKLSNGNPDIALFDFTSIKKAANASRIIERKKHRLMVALVGDSLIEPFWPTGSGAGRGVLSALDVAWMIHQFAAKNPPLAVLRERENIFKLLSVTTNDSLQKNYKAFTIDPKTRYSGFDTKRVSNITSLKGLYDTDDQGNADFSIASPVSIEQKKKPAARRRTSSGGGARKTSSHVNLHTHVNKPKRKSDRVDLKDQATVGNTKKFWEEHNQNNFAEKAKSHVSKQKQKISVASTESGEELETLSDLEDDVIEDEPMIKKGFSKSKSVKHQKEDKKKGFFHAKGGGLKSKSMIDHTKKTPEKSDSRARKKSLSTKKSTGNVQGKRHHSLEGKDEPVKKKEPPRYVSLRSSTMSSFKYQATSTTHSNLAPRKKVLRKSISRNSSILQKSGIERKGSLRKFNAHLDNIDKRTVRKSSIRRNESVKRFRRKSGIQTRSKSKLGAQVKSEDSNRKTKSLRRSTGKAALTSNSNSRLCYELRERPFSGSIPSFDGLMLPKPQKRPRFGSERLTKKLESKSLNLPEIKVIASDNIITAKNPKMIDDSLCLPVLKAPVTRLCPLGSRNRLAVPGMIGKFSFQTRLEGNRVMDDQTNPYMSEENENSYIPHYIKKNRPSNFKMVRLNSVKNKRKSMLRKR